MSHNLTKQIKVYTSDISCPMHFIYVGSMSIEESDENYLTNAKTLTDLNDMNVIVQVANEIFVYPA